jgi:hypothetical protein
MSYCSLTCMTSAMIFIIAITTFSTYYITISNYYDFNNGCPLGQSQCHVIDKIICNAENYMGCICISLWCTANIIIIISYCFCDYMNRISGINKS